MSLAEERGADVRARIVAQAEAYFRQFGYQKTTVADIAKALRMSPANVYRFFESKKAINEAVARQLMGEVEDELAAIAGSGFPPAERLVRFVIRMHTANASRYIGDRMIHEMVAVALDESWDVVRTHILNLRAMLARIVADGLATGDFSGVDPATAAACIQASTVKFCHPMLIAQCASGDPGPDLPTILRFGLRGLGYRGSVPQEAFLPGAS